MSEILKTEEKKEYYVYVYLDPKKTDYHWKFEHNGVEQWFDLEPFYIGRGSKVRSYAHLCKSNREMKTPFYYKLNKILKEYSIVYFKNFLIFKICKNLTFDEANLLEKTLIERFGRENYEKHGILTNTTLGGEGSCGNRWSDERKKLFSEFKKKEFSLNDEYHNNKKVYQIDKNKNILNVFKSLSQVSKKLGLTYGKLNSSITRGKIIFYNETLFIYEENYKNKEFLKSFFLKMDLKIKKDDFKNKRVVQLDLSLNFINEYETAIKASHFLKLEIGDIYNCLRRKNLSVNNYVFIHSEVYFDLKLFNDFKINFLKRKPILNKFCKFDLNGNFLAEYDSLKDAAKSIGENKNIIVIKKKISCCLKNKGKSAYGFIWKFID